MTFLGERMRNYRRKSNITQKEIAHILGVSQGQISRYENCEDEPSYPKAKQIAELLHVSVDFLFGVTNSIESENPRKIPQSNAEVIPNTTGKFLPLYESAAAGIGAEPLSEPINYIPALPGMKGDMWVIVRGDSMTPRINDGEWVLVDKSAPIQHEDVVIALVDGHIYCKYYVIEEDGAVALYSHTNKHKPIYQKNGIQFEIIGKVVKVLAQP